MKIKKMYKTLITVLIIIASLISVNPVKATETDLFSKLEINSVKDENKENIKYFKLNNDIVFKGLFSDYTWYFKVDKMWDTESVNLDFLYSVTQIIDKSKDATITFSLNGTPFYSQKVFYTETNLQNIKLQFPKNLIKEGINDLKIEGYCRITDKPCSDDVNNANWITIGNQTNILAKFKNRETSNNISQFPYPFYRVNENRGEDCLILIPDNYKESQLTAALMLAAYFGRINEYGEYRPIIRKLADNKEKFNGNIIYIGNYENMPKDYKALYGNSDTDFNTNASIKLVSTNNKANKIMSILSENDELLIKAARALANDKLVTQLQKDNFIINNSTNVIDTKSSKETKLTFKDLGYNELKLVGQFRRNAVISYLLPKNKVLSHGSSINLFTRYSDNLDFDKSLLTIYVNGTPIGSKKLEKDKVNRDELKLEIPSDVTSSNYIEINIAFDLQLENSSCETRQQDMPWALVTGESNFHFSSNDLSFYSFDTYPNPFVFDNKFNNLGLVIPDEISSIELTSLSALFSYMGKEVKDNSGDFTVIKSSNFSDKQYNKNIILYGTPQNNGVIKKVNSNLWFKYNEGYNKLLSNEKLYLSDTFSENISQFQFDISPFNKQTAILIITSPNEETLRKSLLYLSSSNGIMKAVGDSLVIDKFGNIRTFKFKEETKKPIYETIKGLNESSKNFIIFIILIAVFFVIATVLYYNKNKSFKEYKKKEKPIKETKVKGFRRRKNKH